MSTLQTNSGSINNYLDSIAGDSAASNPFKRVSVKIWIQLILFAILGVIFWPSASPAMAHHTQCNSGSSFAEICNLNVFPRDVTWGNSITVSWRQQNQFRRQVFLWRCLGYSNDPRCIEREIQPVQVSSSSSLTWTIPTCQRPGNYRILVYIWDRFGSVDLALPNESFSYDLIIRQGSDPCLDSVSVNPTTVQHGKTQTVTWSSINQQSYQLELFTASGQSGRTIQGRTQSTAQSRAWTVPTDLAPGNYFVKVTIWNSRGQSVSKQSPSFIVPNRAPVLHNHGNPSLTAINEDAAHNGGSLVAAIISSVSPLDLIADPDPGTLEALAITAVDNSKGAWEYSTNNGTNWTPFGRLSASSARLLAGDSNTRIRFVPNPNFNGPVNPGITFRAWDQSSGSNGGTANTSPNGGSTAFSTATETAGIAVNPVNDPPSFTKGPNQIVNEDTGLRTIQNWATNISAGPANEMGQSLTFRLSNSKPDLFATQPSIAANGTLTYQLAINAHGSAVITIWLQDSGGTANGGVDVSPPQTFTITINPVNDPPSAVDDQATTSLNTPRTISILDNDTDPDNDPLTVTQVSQPAHGTVRLNPDKTVTYTPNANFTGNDTFTYTVRDPAGLTDTATVTVNVEGPNTPPVAVNDVATAVENRRQAIAVLDNDSDLENDPLTVIALSIPANGTAATNGTIVIYTPKPGFKGVDSFTYTVSDGELTAIATVMVTVTAAPVRPWEDDNFDSLRPDALDGQNGWAGRPSAQVIPYPGRGQVLEINPGPNATIALGKNIPDQTSGRHRFEVDVMIANATHASLAKVEVRTVPSAGWDKKFQIYFGSSIRVNYSPNGAAAIIVPATQTGTWYHLQVELNLTTGLFDVWVDGNPVVSGLPMHPGPITDLGLQGWDLPGTVYLDNLLGTAQAELPMVTITAPSQGATVSGPVVVQANASASVTRVEFYVDGVLQSADSARPYEFVWDTTVNPLPTPNHATDFGYYFVEWKDPATFDAYRAEVNGYTNQYYATRSTYASELNPAEWRLLLGQSLADAVAENKRIHLALEAEALWDDVLDVAAPHWRSVSRIEIEDEPSLSYADTEAMIQRLRAKLNARGLPHRPMGFVYKYDQPLPDAISAPSLDWVGIEAYLNSPGSPGSQVNIDALNAHLQRAKAQVPAGKQIVLVMMAYDRNGTWANMDTLRDLQIPVYLQAYNDPRVVAITMFAYTRAGGSRDHQELRTPHRLTGERLLGISVPSAGNGLRTLSVKAYDSAGNSITDRVMLTVANPLSSDPPNVVPTIAPINNQIIAQDTTLGPLPITLANVNNDVDSLTISASSSNQALVPDANIILGGSGTNRTLAITPAKVSIAEPTDVTITVSVSDGAATTRTSFTLTVRPAGSDSFIYLPIIIRSEP